MGAMCVKTATTVIPDREVMIQVVDMIVEFEKLLKGGTELTKEQKAQSREYGVVVRDIKKVLSKTKVEHEKPG